MGLTEQQKRWCELILIFLLLPLASIPFKSYLTTSLLPLLCVIAIICLRLLLHDKSFKRFRLVNSKNLGALLWHSPLLFLIGIMASLFFFQAFTQLEKVVVVTEHTHRFIIILLTYPLFSVLPQELIFRTYFFHRYKRIIPAKTARILLSAFVFALAHAIYGNLWAILLAFLGGLIFAYTYAITRSTLAVVLEHSVWGLWLFAVGLGDYLDLAKTATG